MSVAVQGCGWVTPLGRDLQGVWTALKNGISAPVSELKNPFTGTPHAVRRVDEQFFSDTARQPRLRRSSAISHMAVAAAMDACRDADHTAGNDRLALLFATTNGGVIYTRRFFADVAERGAHSGSPLLFPETVYNAPASHVAAALSIAGTVSTMVNDATAGIDAVAAAIELLESDACDRCLVVAAEEADWIICDGYATWNYRPVIFSEGAGALLLGRDGDVRIDCPPTCRTYRTIPDGRRAMKDVVARLCGDRTPDLLISPASGTRFDGIVSELPGHLLQPGQALGEAFAASTVFQLICGVLARRETPGLSLVPVVGLHGQLSAATITR